MRIPVREAEAIVSKTERMYREWPHAKRQWAVAAVLGYKSWQALIQACEGCQECPPADGDLSADERAERCERMSIDAAPLLGWELPEAYEFVHWLRPFEKWGLSASEMYWMHGPTINKACAEDEDLWWASASQVGHPLVPLGFELHVARRWAEGARGRINRDVWQRNEKKDEQPGTDRLWVLIPDDHEKPHKTAGCYFRRGKFVEVEPVPLGSELYGSKASAARELDIFMKQYYPHLKSMDQRAAVVHQWVDAIKTMREIGGLDRKSRVKNAKPTMAARRNAGVAWYWPLTLTAGQEDAEAKGLQHAERVDAEILAKFGRDPGWMTD